MPDADGKYVFGTVKVGEKGQIVIPRDARKLFGIQPGDTLLVLGDEKQGGLAIVKAVVDRHAGRIELAQSALGGLRVAVHLPLAGAGADAT